LRVDSDNISKSSPVVLSCLKLRFIRRSAMLARQYSKNLSADTHQHGGVIISALDEIKSEVKRVIPPLSDDRFKGQSGKVAVLGGCREYTGPPYFAAISALKVGGDLAHVFCTASAAAVIKIYSPELIVHPYFSESTDYKDVELTEEKRASIILEATAEVESWFTRLDCLVVGPGLGRDPLLLDIARSVILHAREAQLPLVLDGDALFLVAREPELVQGYTQCVLTPNLNEFRRLASTMGVSLHGPNNDRIKKIHDVVLQLSGPTMVSKGPVDVICDGKTTVVCSTQAGARRCGSQGDILTGCLAVFVSWTLAFLENAAKSGEVVLPEYNPMILASFGGCTVTRAASACAFAIKRRSMLAGDMVEQMGNAVDVLFDAASTMAQGNTEPAGRI